MAIWLPTLKQWLISVFIDILLWEFQISIQIIAILDLDDVLMILSLEAKEMLLKKYMFFRIVLIMLELINMLVPSIR